MEKKKHLEKGEKIQITKMCILHDPLTSLSVMILCVELSPVLKPETLLALQLMVTVLLHVQTIRQTRQCYYNYFLRLSTFLSTKDY